MTNRLASSASPYLLQHADNPVDWYEWGDEAFAAARERDVPVLLSVGYSACHWCHVMAHESFEDPDTAAEMNRRFVNVKVDREERPDVDRVYMDAVQAMTGRGGWPMTVFLTPQGEPFFAGTYFPAEARGGLPPFRQVLVAVSAAWETKREEIVGQAAKLTEAISRSIPPADEVPGAAVVDAAFTALGETFDRAHGGFGDAPKFPQAPTLEFMLRLAADPASPHASEAELMLSATLDAMAAGGIYDHLGGGFARYAVDAHWLVPHFEKMLYDNALLARLYLRAWQVTGIDHYRTVTEETLEYLLRDLRHPDGGFYSAEDADSEGEEGRFYVFTRSEFEDVLGDDAAFAAAAYGVTEEGNFEGSNVLHRPRSVAEIAAQRSLPESEVRERLDGIRRRLLDARSRRVRPGVDDKVITAWNGLALRAFAEAGVVLDEPRYLDAARDNARFVLDHLRRPDGRLLRAWRRGTATVPAFCDDHGAYALGLLALYQATGETEWFLAAGDLLEAMTDLFSDPAGGFFATGADAERLIDRPKNLMDNPIPSDNALAAEALSTMAALSGDAAAATAVDGVLTAAGRLAAAYPQAVGQLLAVVATRSRAVKEVAIVGGPGSEDLTAVVWETYRPDCIVAVGDGGGEGTVPLLEGRPAGPDGAALAYVCRDFVCDAPVRTAAELRDLLETAGR
jgi:uncharacterized protein